MAVPLGHGALLSLHTRIPLPTLRFPGHRDYHDTATRHGANPTYHDEATWLIARTPDLEHAMRRCGMTRFQRRGGVHACDYGRDKATPGLWSRMP